MKLFGSVLRVGLYLVYEASRLRNSLQASRSPLLLLLIEAQVCKDMHLFMSSAINQIVFAALNFAAATQKILVSRACPLTCSLYLNYVRFLVLYNKNILPPVCLPLISWRSAQPFDSFARCGIGTDMLVLRLTPPYRTL